MTTGQVVDTETAQEFMVQTLEQASRAELGDLVAELQKKSARFREWLSPDALLTLERQQLRGLLRSIFATRRKADAILDVMGVDGLRNSIRYLLYGEPDTQERYQHFVDCLSGYWGDVRLARKPLPGQGEAAGFAKFGVSDSPFGIDVFLSCVYAVYVYTTLRLRMTQEFNKVVPQLPELSRRLLGVWKMEL